ncbi:MAG: ORF6N domain-containing protein [Spirochaetia bacterium]|nr:ORF6N domain-containing protein [Spirochaetia bacterium]
MNDLLNIENKILVIRSQQVMLDRDLAELYGVETKVLNQAVKRNIERFPERFMFQLTKTEQNNAEDCLRSQFVTLENLKSQIVTSRKRGKYSKYLPYVFTEQGVAMLASVLKSPTAVQISIKIMDAFVAMRRFLLNNAKIFTEIDSIKEHLLASDLHQKESDERIDTLFTLMDKYKIKDKQDIFFQGQIFDAYSTFQRLIQKAKKEIILIDNYIDLTVLDRLTQKNVGVNVTIYTRPDTPIKQLDIDKFNTQYPTLTIKHTSTMHDRFLILDNTDIYHIGASIKDLGKKCFGFTQLEDAAIIINAIMQNL